jgi:hypothetical protein
MVKIQKFGMPTSRKLQNVQAQITKARIDTQWFSGIARRPITECAPSLILAPDSRHWFDH